MTTATRPTTHALRARPRPAHPARRPRPPRTSAGRCRKIRSLHDLGLEPRELIAREGAAGSTLLIDRDSATAGDERLIAHLSADEPRGNAELLCRLYAETPPEERRCRPVTDQDSSALPLESRPLAGAGTIGEIPAWTVDRRGMSFRLEARESRMSIPELRWTSRCASSSERRTLSLRDCVAAAEDYEPFRSITREAVERHAADAFISTTTLGAELERVLESPIVLNRRLREAVLERVERDGSSLSEIAIRCGRIKRDSRGNESGETSWLARRIGVLPEGGQSEPTVWVHSDVLALIARDGLGVGPREVELG